MTKSKNTAKGKQGRKARKPLCVIYNNGKDITAALVSPVNDQIREETSSGAYAALGKLKDKGYDFGDISKEVPEWVHTKVPKSAKVVGVANIIGFPI